MQKPEAIRKDLDELLYRDGGDWAEKESFNPRCPYCIAIITLKWMLGEVSLPPTESIFNQPVQYLDPVGTKHDRA